MSTWVRGGDPANVVASRMAAFEAGRAVSVLTMSACAIYGLIIGMLLTLLVQAVF